VTAISLADLPPRRPARLETPGPGVPRRLLELGFVAGTRVEVVRRGPLGDPIELELRGYRVCVRRTDLSDLWATLLEQPT
jgi:ferrous iron transport protein A